MRVNTVQVAGLSAPLVALLLSSSALLVANQDIRPISELSRLMLAEGHRHSAEGDLDSAIDYFEAALVADPRNADAHIGLGEVARQQQLPGKAVGHFRGALALRPNDRLALAQQGTAMVARGAINSAQANLQLLNRLCGDDPCAERDSLARALGRPPSRATTVQRDDVLPNPVVEPAEAPAIIDR